MHRTRARIQCPACHADKSLTRSVNTLGRRVPGLTVRKMTEQELMQYGMH
jgi:hypothetical protein